MATNVTSTQPAFVSLSATVGTDYHVYVAAPASDGASLLPAVVVLDGDHFFDVAVGAARDLQAGM